MSDYVLDYFSTCLVGQSPDDFFIFGQVQVVTVNLCQLDYFNLIGDYASTIGITF